MDKLIRDKIAHSIRELEGGGDKLYRLMPEPGKYEAYWKHDLSYFLSQKVQEESEEVARAVRNMTGAADGVEFDKYRSDVMEEIGDLLEVAEAAAHHLDLDWQGILRMKKYKRESKGGFDELHVLIIPEGGAI
ncbi:MAG: hypothetical protein LC687_00865 [Actinobacteria bacterium]|nr:hypothetical protein [Actinomycetota bacterium]MCA1806407.1 hypothetical protein [Actinomycetota bacterium]